MVQPPQDAPATASLSSPHSLGAQPSLGCSLRKGGLCRGGHSEREMAASGRQTGGAIRRAVLPPSLLSNMLLKIKRKWNFQGRNKRSRALGPSPPWNG